MAASTTKIGTAKTPDYLSQAFLSKSIALGDRKLGLNSSAKVNYAPYAALVATNKQPFLIIGEGLFILDDSRLLVNQGLTRILCGNCTRCWIKL